MAGVSISSQIINLGRPAKPAGPAIHFRFPRSGGGKELATASRDDILARIVETSAADALFASQKPPLVQLVRCYTTPFLRLPNPRGKARCILLEGESQSALDSPSWRHFIPACHYAIRAGAASKRPTARLREGGPASALPPTNACELPARQAVVPGRTPISAPTPGAMLADVTRPTRYSRRRGFDMLRENRAVRI